MNVSGEQVAAMAPGERVSLVKTAHNAATESENKIHDDAEARRLGLRGGLVPGVTLYAYLTELVLPLLGPSWLRRGSCFVRFIKPVYEIEEVTCTATLNSRRGDADRGEATLDLTVIGPDGGACVTGSAGLRWGDGDEPGAHAWPAEDSGPRRLPEQRPELTRETAPIGKPLKRRTVTIDAELVEAYANETGDPNPWYRGGSPFGLPLVPPGLLAGQPARLLRENFSFGPSVHTASEIQHLGLALAGGEYHVDGTILETFEKRGNDYQVSDIRISDHAGAPVMRIRHTSIFRFAPRG